jgi:nucleotide-binding universal stress UspA family protein
MSDEVIVGIDGRDQSQDALALAHLLARTLGGKLVLANVVASTAPGWSGAELDPAVGVEGRELLDHAAAGIEEVPVERRVLEWPSAAAALHDLAVDLDARLLVVGSAHRGAAGRLLLGSVAHGLLSGAPCPVAVAPLGYRDRVPDRLRTIGVAYDGQAEADRALDFALAAADTSGAELRLWFAVSPTGLESANPERYAEFAKYIHDWAHKQLARGVDRAGDRARVGVDVLEGDPAREIADAAASQDTDLLVCGSRGYGPLRRVFAGSTSRRLIDLASRPLVVMPRPDEAPRRGTSSIGGAS